MALLVSAAPDEDGNFIGKYTTKHFGRVFDDCVYEVIDTEGKAYTTKFSAAAKYVRRDPKQGRSDAFLRGTEGRLRLRCEKEYRAKYGSRVPSIKYFEAFEGAGTTDCDHWHGQGREY